MQMGGCGKLIGASRLANRLAWSMGGSLQWEGEGPQCVPSKPTLGEQSTSNKTSKDMKITVTESMFCEQFKRVRPEQFSNAALEALFAYYEEIEQGSGDEMEFDVVAICCDWTEYDSALEAAESYGFKPKDASDDERADTNERAALEFLTDETTVLELGEGNGVVVLNY